MAEVLFHPAGRSHKTGFTLAEVLITLGIIGVVAALILPSIMSNINERVNSEREANIAYKITQATDKMKALGLLNGSYASTDAFVDELQKHLKIVKRCDANHIADCWPTEKVTTTDGEIFEVSKAKKGKNLQLENNKSNNVGLILADGASIILTYNQDSEGMNEGDEIKASNKPLPVGGKFKEFAYTTNSTAAIDFVMDVNGAKGPNSETINNKYHDIRSFKVARFSKGCAGLELDDIGCVVNLSNTFEAIDTCDGTQYSEYDSYGSKNQYCSNNRWAGAKKACADMNMRLASTAELQSILTSGNDDFFTNVGNYAFVMEEHNNECSKRVFTSGSSKGVQNLINKNGPSGQAICIGK